MGFVNPYLRIKMKIDEAIKLLQNNGYSLMNERNEYPPADQWIYIISNKGKVLKIWAWNTDDAFEQAEAAGFKGEEYKTNVLHYDYVIKDGKLITEHYNINENITESGIIAYVRSVIDEFPEKGELEFTSRGALNDAWVYLKSLGYKLQYTSDVDENLDNVTHYIEYKIRK